ncbi:MAG: alanine racemase [Clostridiales bacterium]|nr:alanine racemase [Clostridiales bacterium]
MTAVEDKPEARDGAGGGWGAEAKDRRPSFVEVDLDAIDRNLRKLAGLTAGQEDCRMMAVVKANAYGHGAVPVAKRALQSGADWLGVALPQEALELRDAGISAPILTLGYTEPEAYEQLIRAGIRMTVYSLSQGKAMAEAARDTGEKARIHLKMDTGMSRIGFFPTEEAIGEIKALASLAELEMEGCFTHFARSDEAEEESWRTQFRLFMDFLARLKQEGLTFPIVHCANTAAGMRDKTSMLNMFRCGIGIYGLYPSEAAEAWGILDLEPALRWISRLSHVKWLPKGQGVGYGHTWIAKRDTLVGTVPIGYADGYIKAFNNKGIVLVGGRRAPVIGVVCMDQFMVDLTETPGACAGDEVVLIGSQGNENIGAQELGALAGANNYQMVCTISGRIPRRYIG